MNPTATRRALYGKMAGDSTLNAVAVYRINKGKLTPFETVLVPDALVVTG